jgi:hypothetical protein
VSKEKPGEIGEAAERPVWNKRRIAASEVLERLDRLYHRAHWLPLRWVCQAYEATNIEEWPTMPDWPGGRVLTAFHRWFWVPTQTALPSPKGASSLD